MLGQDAAVDDLVVGEDQAVAWRETAARFSARLFLIECICSGEAIHRERIEGRYPWHSGVARVDRLTVDAMEPVADNLRRVLEYISA
jgi:hypothetical protein